MNRLFNKVKDYLLFTPKEQGDDFYLNSQQDNTEYDVREEKIETTENDKVFKNIEENLSYVKDR